MTKSILSYVLLVVLIIFSLSLAEELETLFVDGEGEIYYIDGNYTYALSRYDVNVKDPFENGVAGVELECEIHYRIKFHEYSDWEDRVANITGITGPDGHAAFVLMVTVYYDEIPDTVVVVGGPISPDGLAEQGIFVTIVEEPENPESTIGWPKYEFDCQEVWITNIPCGYSIIYSPNTYTIHSIAVVTYLALNSADDLDGNHVADVFEQSLAQKFCPSLVLHSGDQGVCPEPVDIMMVDMTNSNNYMYTDLWNGLGQHVPQHPRTDEQWYVYQLHSSNTYFPPSNGLFWPSDNYSYFNGCIYGIFDPPYLATGWYQVIFHPDFGGPDCDTHSEWYSLYNQVKNNYPHTIYPHLFQNGNETVIQYWFFYPFNAFVNNHEGDWEHINVVLDSQIPSTADIIRVEYYFHFRVLNRYPPSEFHVVDQTNPVVFVGGHGELSVPLEGTWIGDGSHGSYPIFGNWIDVGARGVDEYVDGSGLYLKYNNFNLEIIPNPSAINYSQSPEMSWLKANISWGQLLISHSAGNYFLYEYSTIPIVAPFRLMSEIFKNIPNDVGNVAPVGPAHNDGWNDVGSSPDGYSFTWYIENPPLMQSWAPPY